MLWKVLATGLLLNLLLVLPAWWRDGQWASVWIAPEAWLLAALFITLPSVRSTRIVAWLVAILMALVIIAAFFDGLLRQVLSRPLNVLLDPLMLQSGFHLIDGSLGRLAAILASVLLAGSCVLLVVGLRRALRPRRYAHPAIVGILVAAGVLTVAGLAGHTGQRVDPVAAELLRKQGMQVRHTLQSQRQFLADLGADQMQARPIPALAGRDVVVVFVESYGVSLLDQGRYNRRLQPLLERWQTRLGAGGLAMRSTRMEAPIRGGQSWLAHASLLAGLRIDNQYWYRLFLDSDQPTLADDFRATGHASIKITPAIIMDWPEGEQLGFDRIYSAADLDYRGPPLGWVTMPDQYTLHHFAEHIRPRHEKPVFAQIALISSHAPWTPLIEPLDWSGIGDGRVFKRWQDASSDPLRLWANPERLRQAYLGSIEYSLEVSLDWALHYLPDDALLIVLGDHQAASPVTGRGVSADVPVHLISSDEQLLERFEAAGLQEGLVPGVTQAVWGLEDIRSLLRGL